MGHPLYIPKATRRFAQFPLSSIIRTATKLYKMLVICFSYGA